MGTAAHDHTRRTDARIMAPYTRRQCSQRVRRDCASGTRACVANTDRQHLFDACALQSTLNRSLSCIALELDAPFQQQRRFREGVTGRAWNTVTCSRDGEAQETNPKPRCRALYRASARRCEINDKIAAEPGRPTSSKIGAECPNCVSNEKSPHDRCYSGGGWRKMPASEPKSIAVLSYLAPSRSATARDAVFLRSMKLISVLNPTFE